MRLVRIQLCVSARSRFVCVFTESTRARTSSTRATHVDARTKSFGPRIRDTDLFIARPCLSFNSSRRSLRRAPARLVSRREEKRDRRRDREHSVPKPQSTPDAPNERTRGTPRGVPTISTCIRVTPTTSRVRFRSARISATAQCVGSDRVSVMRNARCARPDAQSMPVARALDFIRASSVTLPSR